VEILTELMLKCCSTSNQKLAQLMQKSPKTTKLCKRAKNCPVSSCVKEPKKAKISHGSWSSAKLHK